MIDAAGIERLIGAHSSFEAHPAGHQERYMRRWKTRHGVELGHKQNHKTVQHIWAAASGLPARNLKDIPHKTYPASDVFHARASNGRDGRHSGLHVMSALAEADLIRFSPRAEVEVCLILDAVAKQHWTM